MSSIEIMGVQKMGHVPSNARAHYLLCQNVQASTKFHDPCASTRLHSPPLQLQKRRTFAVKRWWQISAVAVVSQMVFLFLLVSVLPFCSGVSLRAASSVAQKTHGFRPHQGLKVKVRMCLKCKMYLDLGEAREKLAIQEQVNQEEVMNKARRQKMRNKLKNAAAEALRKQVRDPQYEYNVNQNLPGPLNAKDPKESDVRRIAKDAAERACLNLQGNAKDECLDRVRTTMEPLQPETKAHNPLDRLANPHAVDDGSVPVHVEPVVTLPEPGSSDSPLPKVHGRIHEEDHDVDFSPGQADRIAAAENEMNNREAAPIAAKAAAFAADKVVVAAKTEQTRLEEAAAVAHSSVSESSGPGAGTGTSMRFVGSHLSEPSDPPATPPVEIRPSSDSTPQTPMITAPAPLKLSDGDSRSSDEKARIEDTIIFGDLPEEKIAKEIAQKMGLEKGSLIYTHNDNETLSKRADKMKSPHVIGPDCHTGMSVHRWGDDESSTETGHLEVPPCKPVAEEIITFDKRSPWSYYPKNPTPSSKDLKRAAEAATKARNAAFAASSAAGEGDLKKASEALESAVASAHLSQRACEDTSGSQKARIACKAAKSALNAVAGAQASKESAEKGDVRGAIAGLGQAQSGTVAASKLSESSKVGGGMTSDSDGTVSYAEPPSHSGRNGRDDANNPSGAHADIGPPYREGIKPPPEGPVPWPFDLRFKEKQSDLQRKQRRGRELLMLPVEGAINRHDSEKLLDPSMVKGTSEDPTLPENRPYIDPRMDHYTLEDESKGTDMNTWEGPANHMADLKMLSEMTVCLNEADEGLGHALFKEMSEVGTVICEPAMMNRAYTVDAMGKSMRL